MTPVFTYLGIVTALTGACLAVHSTTVKGALMGLALLATALLAMFYICKKKN